MGVLYSGADFRWHPDGSLRVTGAKAGSTDGTASRPRADAVAGLKGEHVRTLYGEGAARYLFRAV